MDCQLDLTSASQSAGLPSQQQMLRWFKAAMAAGLKEPRPQAQVSVYLVDAEEGRALNQRYRGKDKATNVLSFPADLPPELGLPLLGDLVICAPVIAREAEQQSKSCEAHWAHMLVHGSLHLLGYDHIDPVEAETMEALETEILAQLNYPAPYAETH